VPVRTGEEKIIQSERAVVSASAQAQKSILACGSVVEVQNSV